MNNFFEAWTSDKQFRWSVLFFGFAVWMYFAGHLAVYGDLFFHSDIARDFLIMEEMVKTRRPTLLGPQAGGTPGFYHGPLWFYVNLPAFIIFQGDPRGVAWWWVILVAINVGIVYVVARKLFDEKVGLSALVLFALIALAFPVNLFNPYGSFLFFPIFFYFWCRYDQTNKVRFLLAAIFTAGLLVQSQVMFGAPMLALTGLALLFKLRKTRNWYHLLSFLILIIPLSTYLLFDVRHDWLQSRAVLDAVLSVGRPKAESGSEASAVQVFSQRFLSRLQLMLTDSFSLVNYLFGHRFLTAVSSVTGFLLLLYAWFKSQKKERRIFNWFGYFFFGYWLLMFFYSGGMWQYYYWSFTTVLVILISTVAVQKGRVFVAMYVSLIAFNLFANYRILSRDQGFVGNTDLSWQFYSRLSRDVYFEADDEFGYYIYTPDLYAYQPRYALNFTSQLHPKKTAAPYQKKRQTFLIFAPPPGDRPFFNGQFWRTDQVKITKEPVQVLRYSNGYRVEEYELSDEEIAVQSDQTMLQGLFFR